MSNDDKTIPKLEINSKVPISHVSKVLNISVEVIKKRQRGEKLGYVTRWPKTNIILGGSIPYGSNLVIGARPGVGKSAYVNILCFDVLELNADVKSIILYWNFEMPAYRQGVRFFSYKSQLSVNELLSASTPIKDEHIQRVVKLKEAFRDKNLFFINEPVTTKTFLEINEQVTVKYPHYRIVNILDHTRLIKDDKEKEEQQKLHNLMGVVNECKLKFMTTNILLSQLNRQIESPERRSDYNRPLMSDLFGADSVGQYAETIFMLYRPEMYNIETMTIGETTVPTKNLLLNEVVKSRDGETGTLFYKHDLAVNKIEEYTIPK